MKSIKKQLSLIQMLMNKVKIANTIKQKYLKTWIILCLDVLASLSSSALVIQLINLIISQYDFRESQVIIWLLSSLIISFIVFRVSGEYRTIIRYSTFKELGRLCGICAVKDLLMSIVVIVLGAFSINNGLLWGMIFIDFVITLCALALLRVAMLGLYDFFQTNFKDISKIQHVLVYGVSDKAIASIARLNNSIHYQIDGFITFGRELKGHSLINRKIYYFENESDIIQVIKKTKISGVLFPYSSDARSEQNRLIPICRKNNLRTYIIPSVDEITNDMPFCNYIRKVKIEDLLGRDEIKISMNEIIKNFGGKIVMVTGAAGSIGSELCRQLANFGIKQLILFDNAETPLHNIRLELEDKYPDLDFVPIIGDVCSLARLDFVFRQYQPQVVFHAAAYKHVPLMEENPCEAVQVNVTGSRQIADKCVEYGVEKMVMVSTDKAVNPTNIMGCTKRIAEIYVQSLGLAIERGEIKGRTIFVTTRFGNVLGSNGSVIPRFRDQIEHGGPVTVTHPEITRFFMTIPEACRLVMEAATFATGPQIFAFDMGQSVKIVNLAERMISLAGLEVGRDIKIEFTGLRPGEKLYEEVLATKENTLPTRHERIFIAKAREYPYFEVAKVVSELTELATLVTISDMVKLMKHTVPEFKSKNSIFEVFD